MTEIPQPHNKERIGTPEHASMGHEHEPQAHDSIDTSKETRASIEELARRVETAAMSSKEHASRQTPETATERHPVLINKQLKDVAYDRALIRVRKKLSRPSRALSKVVHSKALDKPSELAAQSVARPSSMLGGGLCALSGSILLYWAVKHYGYEYNYLVVIILFAVGWLGGLLVEFTLRSVKKK